MRRKTNIRWCVLMVFAVSAVNAASTSLAQQSFPGTSVVTFHGYPDCLQLENETTRVVISPIAGGRVLDYSLHGVNSLYLEEEATGKPYRPGERASMSAGRFDIGPEKIIPRRPKLWSGDWNGKITGPRKARLISQRDEATGAQLIREFELDETSSHLRCTQTIRNISDGETRWCHWSRTFAVGGGICVIPTSDFSRFPEHYVMYEGGDQINLRPKDANIRRRDGFLEILAPPREPKLGMDSREGWMAYAAPNDLLFVKQFEVDPERVYNEVAGLTISVWYPSTMPVIELEPIGPEERLQPGGEASFTEHWRLAKFPFPRNGETLSLDRIKSLIDRWSK